MDQNELENRPEMVHPARMDQETRWMDQKQKLGHIPQTANHAGAAHKHAIQCENLRIRRAPFVSQQIIPTSNRQNRAATQDRDSSRTASSCDEKFPYGPHFYGLLSLACIRLGAMCAFTESHTEEGLRNHLLRSHARQPFAKPQASPRIEKLIRPTCTASIPNRSNHSL